MDIFFVHPTTFEGRRWNAGIDNKDAALKPEIETLETPKGRPLDVVVTDTIMDSMQKKSALARTALQALGA